MHIWSDKNGGEVVGGLRPNSPAFPNGSIDSIPIGSVTPSTGAFTSLSASGTATFAGIASSIPDQVYNAVSTAPTANALALTGANISGGSTLTVLNLTAALSAGAAANLPAVAAFVAAMTSAGIPIVAGGSYELDVYNSSSGNFAWTVTTATGWTLNGTMTVAQNTYRKFIVTFTSLTAVVLQSLGQFAIGSGI